ncbi:MAG: OsmC family peroxiredoxin, partial [Gemmatimonadetes bacterium]|nr:OsmC family peroxiredoxin [Gemmatimonadota bacterium]
MPTSNASAVWAGKLKDGNGKFTAGSGAFSGAYTFATRFEGARGTTPEELIAAAHAACLSMALSAGLEKSGTPATRIETRAACTLEMVGGGP